MTTSDLPLESRAARARSAFLSPSVLATAVCLLLAILLTRDHAREIWRTGAFFDTDDATRAVQLRAWLAGQDWYDLSIARMDPPAGVFMHWSRVVDVPLAALVTLAKPWLGADMAERFARLVFPAGLFAALLLAAGWAAGVTGGARARAPGIVLCFLGAPFLGQFIPGRIDHHAPQILLLVLMTGGALAAFDPARARLAALSALSAALSLAISLENLPFIAIVAAAFPLLFVVRGETARPALLWFAGTLAPSMTALFLATVGPAHRFEGACDAFSLAHLAAGVAGSAALLVLALLAPRLRSRPARVLATLACAPLPIVALAVAAPRCLGDPFVGLDPLVRDIWLGHVGEVESVSSFLRTHVWSALAMLVPMVCAAALAIAGVLRGSGVARARYALLAALLLMALAMTQWGIRAFSSGLPLVALAAAPALRRFADRFESPVARLVAMGVGALPLAPFVLALALPSDAAPGGQRTLSCLTPQALAPVAALPRGMILAPIDAGAHLLALTPHSVLGAPYHRDNAGNRAVIDAMLSPPDAARAMVARTGATYVAICAGEDQANVMAARAPDGLAAALLAGRVPAWLDPLNLPSPQKLFRMKPEP